MAQRAILVGSVVLAGALLGASSPWSRVLPECSELPAAQRESARLAGRCEGRAPIVNVRPASPQAGASRIREVQLPRKPVPDLRGRPFNRSDERLARFVVAIDYRESPQRRDWVIDQQPRPPARLPEGGSLRVVLSDGALVRVPDVRGNFARALATLYRAGLSWSTGEASAGPVVGQVPAPGAAVKPGTQIVLRLAPGPIALAPESTRPEVAPGTPPPVAPPSGAPAPPATRAPANPPMPGAAPATTAMPDVQGMIFDAARERLAAFNVQRVHRAGTEPGGTVIGQSPAAGTPLAPGTTVRLVLSDGTLVRVPRVMSFTLAEARQRLSTGELRPMITNVASDAPSGTVISQQPAEGAIAQRGSAIRIGVSTGPARAAAPPAAAATVAVPNVVGALFDRARPQLDGFTVERSERAAREPVGTILEQSPPAGTQVAPGSAIAIVVSSGGRPEVIEVANVVGQDAEAATRTLSEFRIERVEVPSTEPAGRVLEQEPVAGAPVPPGSTVRLLVSNASLARVPSFAHMTLAQARDAARAAGLALAPRAGGDDDSALVKGQQPAAGAEIPRGSALQVEVEPRALPFDVPPAVRDAWTRASSLVTLQPSRNLAIAAVLLVALLALLLLALRRRRPADAPMVEPVFARTRTMEVERSAAREPPPSSPEAASPTTVAPSGGEAVPAPPTAPDLPPRAPRRPAKTAAAGPTLAERRAKLATSAAPAAPIPAPEPVVYGARARLEANPDETVATGAGPRGPEIRIAARLEAGETGFRELPTAPARDELTEETK